MPTAFLRSWIKSHYQELITEIFREEVPGTLRVDIAIRSAVRGGGVTIRQPRVAEPQETVVVRGEEAESPPPRAGERTARAPRPMAGRPSMRRPPGARRSARRSTRAMSSRPSSRVARTA